MKQEIWKDVVGYEGLYQVSNLGRVKSLDRNIVVENKFGTHERVLKGRIIKYTIAKGRYEVGLFANGVRRTCKVHRLVADAFIPKINGKNYIDHIDGNPKNNSVSNLRWCTHAENCNFKIAIQRKKKALLKNKNASKNRNISDYVTNFMYYLFNKWSEDEAIFLFGESLGKHIYNKWINRQNNDSLMWYAELDRSCKQTLVKRSNEIYNKDLNV